MAHTKAGKEKGAPLVEPGPGRVKVRENREWVETLAPPDPAPGVEEYEIDPDPVEEFLAGINSDRWRRC